MGTPIQCPCCGSTVSEIKEVLTFGRFTIDLRTYTVNGTRLTPREFDILMCLVLNKGRILTRTQIVDKAMGLSYQGLTNLVDVYIRYLRAKLGPDIIETARGIGYIFNPLSN